MRRSRRPPRGRPTAAIRPRAHSPAIAAIARSVPPRTCDAGDVGEPEHAERDQHDVLARDGEQVVEARGLERVAQRRIDALVGTQHDSRHEGPPLAARPECESSGDLRAQPVAHATDPAPPADDTPPAARVQDDVDPPPRKPAALVETGLGPSRDDRPRPQLEDGPLWRRPTRGKLEQHAFPEGETAEAAHLCRGSDREPRHGRRALTTTRARRDVADAAGEHGALERRRTRDAPHQRPSAASATPSTTRRAPLDQSLAAPSAAVATMQRRAASAAGPSWRSEPEAGRNDEHRRPARPASLDRPTRTRLTASRGRVAARPAPVRSRGSRRDRRPSETARAPAASRRSSAPSPARCRVARRVRRRSRSRG